MPRKAKATADVAPSYEATALAGTLTPEQRRAIIAAFAEDHRFERVLAKVDVPADLLHQALADPALLQEALAVKRGYIGQRFVAVSFDVLLAIAMHPDQPAAQRIKALAALGGMLNVQVGEAKAPSAARGRPKKAVADPTPGIEVMLRELRKKDDDP